MLGSKTVKYSCASGQLTNALCQAIIQVGQIDREKWMIVIIFRIQMAACLIYF
jgi:hypothetical protein